MSQQNDQSIRRERNLKLGGLGFLTAPLGVLMLFTVGEVAGGDFSGLQHLVQAFPLALLACLAWQRPRLGGRLLAGIGVMLAVLHPIVFAFRRFPIELVIGVELVLYIPSIAAGVLFMLAARQRLQHPPLPSWATASGEH